MEPLDLVPLLGPMAAFMAPLLVWAAARARLRHDERRSHADEDSTLWERMAALVDRYGKRADELELTVQSMRARLDTAEAAANTLSRKIAGLEIDLTRWRAYAVALVTQVRGAGLTPVNPNDYGLSHDTDGHAPRP